MNELQEVKKALCDMKGSLMAVQAMLFTILRAMPPVATQQVAASLPIEAEAAKALLLGSEMSETTIEAFDREIQGLTTMLAQLAAAKAALVPPRK